MMKRVGEFLWRVLCPPDYWTTKDCDEAIARLERKHDQITVELAHWRQLRRVADRFEQRMNRANQ